MSLSSAPATSPPATPLIMVVDDEVDITETYALLLELHDFKVVVAGNGAEALAKLAIAMPDLIISDCMMPVMNGIDFVAALRRLPGGAHVPVILCSGAPELHDLSSCDHALFLRKPVFFDRLLEAVNSLLPPR